VSAKTPSRSVAQHCQPINWHQARSSLTESANPGQKMCGDRGRCRLFPECAAVPLPSRMLPSGPGVGWQISPLSEVVSRPGQAPDRIPQYSLWKPLFPRTPASLACRWRHEASPRRSPNYSARSRGPDENGRRVVSGSIGQWALQYMFYPLPVAEGSHSSQLAGRLSTIILDCFASEPGVRCTSQSGSRPPQWLRGVTKQPNDNDAPTAESGAKPTSGPGRCLARRKCESCRPNPPAGRRETKKLAVGQAIGLRREQRHEGRSVRSEMSARVGGSWSMRSCSARYYRAPSATRARRRLPLTPAAAGATLPMAPPGASAQGPVGRGACRGPYRRCRPTSAERPLGLLAGTGCRRFDQTSTGSAS
jgi:hypothetical protein